MPRTNSMQKNISQISINEIIFFWISFHNWGGIAHVDRFGGKCSIFTWFLCLVII